MEPGETHSNPRIDGPLSFETVFISPESFESMTRELGISGIPHFSISHVGNQRVYLAIAEFLRAVRQGATALEEHFRRLWRVSPGVYARAMKSRR